MVQKIFRPKKVCELFAIVKSTLYQQIKDGEFPPPNMQTGKRGKGWTEDLLDKEQARRLAKRPSERAA
jgi:predicted DNA-binding transcriptional regulator AlpA